MPKLRFTYFDIKGSRGQVARLALALAGESFEDVRIGFQDFVAQKGSFPFGALPILEVDGQVISQSNAINRYIGKMTSLYPTDPLQAAFCDEAMAAVEDILHKAGLTIFIKDEDEKKKAREALATGPIPLFLKGLAARLADRKSDYFADNRLTVADLKVFVWVRSLNLGILDHVPNDIVETHAPELKAHHDRIWSFVKIRAQYDD
jgi:glutathione S-transferase